MNNISRNKWRTVATIGAILLVSGFSGLERTQAQGFDVTCGDADGNGSVNVGDLTYMLSYLYEGGPAPPDLLQADMDGRFGLNVGDVGWFDCCCFCDPWFRYCPPTEPKLVAVVDSTFLLRYANVILPNMESAVITLVAENPPIDANIMALVARVRLENAPVQIDSILYPYPGSEIGSTVGLQTLDSDSAEFVLSEYDLLSHFDYGPDNADTIAQLYLSFEPNASLRNLEITPAVRSPLQAPTADSSLETMFYREFYFAEPISPVFEGHCCLVPGDANFDGRVTIGDVTFGIARIFSGGPGPICMSSADANADGSYNIGDNVLILNYIFGIGPAPVCGP